MSHAAVVPGVSGLCITVQAAAPLCRLNVCHSSCSQIPGMMAIVANIGHYKKNVVKEKNKL